MLSQYVLNRFCLRSHSPSSRTLKGFGALAVNFSEDQETRYQGGDLGWIERGRFPQRFEKAVSGMYIGQILREVFPEDGFDEHTDGKALTDIINAPDQHKNKHVKVAKQIYKRSAKLVAASLAGLIDLLRAKGLLAEGDAAAAGK